MLSAGLNGVALVHWSFMGLLQSAGHSALGMLGTMLELVVFCAVVWALLGSRSNSRRAQKEKPTQRFRARQKELTLK